MRWKKNGFAQKIKMHFRLFEKTKRATDLWLRRCRKRPGLPHLPAKPLAAPLTGAPILAKPRKRQRAGAGWQLYIRRTGKRSIAYGKKHFSPGKLMNWNTGFAPLMEPMDILSGARSRF